MHFCKILIIITDLDGGDEGWKQVEDAAFFAEYPRIISRKKISKELICIIYNLKIQQKYIRNQSSHIEDNLSIKDLT